MWNLRIVNIYLRLKADFKSGVKVLFIFYSVHAIFFFFDNPLDLCIVSGHPITVTIMTWIVSHRNAQVLYIFYKVLNLMFSFYYGLCDVISTVYSAVQSHRRVPVCELSWVLGWQAISQSLAVNKLCLEMGWCPQNSPILKQCLWDPMMFFKN